MSVRDSRVVLVVEDDPTIRQIILWLLEDCGYTTTSASDGREALECARACPPSVVILDLGLPILDGLRVAELLRRTDGSRPEIIVVSAEREARRKSLALGAFELVSKPFDVDELLQSVERALSQCHPIAAGALPRHANSAVIHPGTDSSLHPGRKSSLSPHSA
ncbi:MAG: response regulator [Chloroflexota bacterium]